jgi:hypothetical protein
MKKLIFFILWALAGFDTAFAQQELKLKPGCELLNAVPNNNGLVILTGNYFLLARHHWMIRCYNPDVSLRYEIPLKNTSAGYYNNIISSSSGNTVYMIQPRAILFSSKYREKLLHIDSIGAFRPYKMKTKIDYSSINAVFADDNNLYFIVYKDNKKRKRKNNSDSTAGMKFIRVDNNDFTESQIKLELPKPDNDATDWKYIGNTKSVSYFTSRKIIDQQHEIYRIGVLDKDGKLLDDFIVETAVTNGPMLGCNSHFYIPGADVVNSNQYTVNVYSDGKHTTVVYTQNPESLGNILFDPATNGFFVYGITGTTTVEPKKLFKPKKVNQTASGYYLFQYNENGELTWKYEGKLAGADDKFRSSGTFVSRQVNIQPGFGNNLKFSVFAATNVTTYEINAKTGKYVKAYNNGFQNPATDVDLGACRKGGDQSAIMKYLSKPDRTTCSKFVFKTPTEYIVLKNYYMDANIELEDFPIE